MLLGIDYGKSKVGLALADSETRLAFAYGTLDNDKNLLQKLVEIAKRENVSKIIIGITHLKTKFPSGIASVAVKPLRFSDSKKLGKFFEEKLKVEVGYQEEMFTTRQAQRNLIEKGVKGVKKFDDQEAARLILQAWLDRPQNM